MTRALLLAAALAVALASCGDGRDAPHLRIRPKVRGDAEALTIAARPTLSILVSSERIDIGATGVAREPWTDAIERGARPAAEVLKQLEAVLVTLKREHFAERTDLELAAVEDRDHRVDHRDLLAVIDVAHAAGFVDVGVLEPAALSWRPPLR